jgi:hypothetical protein
MKMTCKIIEQHCKCGCLIQITGFLQEAHQHQLGLVEMLCVAIHLQWSMVTFNLNKFILAYY